MPPNTFNLLESRVLDGLLRASKIAQSKKRQTKNLDRLATFEMFQLTKDLRNEDLVLLVTEFGEDDAYEKSEHNVKARRLRSSTMVRSSKFTTLNDQAVKLLTVNSLSKGKIVKSWIFALILEAARKIIAEARESGNVDDLNHLNAERMSVSGPLIVAAIEQIYCAVNEKFEKSEAGVISNSNIDSFLLDVEFKPNLEKGRTAIQEKESAVRKSRAFSLEAEIRRFLPFAGSLVLAEMQRDCSEEECLQTLEANVLPIIDEYPFGEDAETNRKFLGDFPLEGSDWVGN